MEYKISEKGNLSLCYSTRECTVLCFYNTNVKGQHFVPKQLTSDSHRPSADLLTANSQRGSQQEGQIKASLQFIFCKGNQFNDMCDKFTTLTLGFPALISPYKLYI